MRYHGDNVAAENVVTSAFGMQNDY